MRNSSLFARSAGLALTGAVTLALSSSALAEARATTTAPVVGKKRAVAAAVGVPAVPSSGTPGAVGKLDEAYGLLRIADHDYKGHRAHAMHDIEAAARELGAKIGGSGKGKEGQKTSDTQLVDAQNLLEGAVSGLTGKAHHHIVEAIRQLSVALKIK